MQVDRCKKAGILSGGKWDNLHEICCRVYDAGYLCPTITAKGGGNQEVKIVDPIIGAIRGRPTDDGQNQQQLEVGGDICNSLTTVQKDNVVVEPHFFVRKLTPKECWRLMGFDDDSFDRAAQKVSNSQLYKQAGNSIVVDVLMAIFKEMMQ